MADMLVELKKELDTLVTEGNLLYYSMADEQGKLPKEFKDDLKKNGIKLLSFSRGYDTWYSKALRVVKQILPDRFPDFVAQYKNEKRKEVDYLTYGISDYILGVKTTRGMEVVADQSSALPKMDVQNSILIAAQARFDSALYDIKEVLQADLFDSELDSATELSKKGFVRAGGAVAGVVLEKHLAHVCENHGIKSKKAHPTISEFNQLLKDADVIDTAKWRYIQHLADIRNLCDHVKDREPTNDDIADLVTGVDKVIKTVA